jgi:hypothetical protein
MMTVKMLLERRYDKDATWRHLWNELAHDKTPRTATQQEYIEYRAELANFRIAQLMRVWDLHKPENKI